MTEFDQLIRDLQNHTLQVKFTKKDGTERIMRCTLQKQWIPATTGNAAGNPNPDVIPVWDLDKSAWRSFNRFSVLSFNKE